LSDSDLAELVGQFVAGVTRTALVERYGISLSSVKRVLRHHGVQALLNEAW
jgi:ribosomal protein S25